IDLNTFSFHEAGGLNLEQLAFALNMDDQHLGIDNFNFKFDHSSLAASINLQYPSIDDLMNHPKNTAFTVDLNHFSLDLNHLFHLKPDLKSNEYLKKLSRKKITANIRAKGSMEQMELSKFLVNWGPNTQLKTHGKFKHLASPDSLWMAIDQL